MPGRPGGSGGANYQQQLKVIMANLNKEISNIQGASMKGLINAAIFIRNETEKTPPLVKGPPLPPRCPGFGAVLYPEVYAIVYVNKGVNQTFLINSVVLPKAGDFSNFLMTYASLTDIGSPSSALLKSVNSPKNIIPSNTTSCNTYTIALEEI
jgi:hypothetical protein